MFGEPRGEVGKAAECVSVPGDQFTFSSLDMR